MTTRCKPRFFNLIAWSTSDIQYRMHMIQSYDIVRVADPLRPGKTKDIRFYNYLKEQFYEQLERNAI